MRKTAVGYAIGKLMQIMGLVLLIPLGIAIWDTGEATPAEILAVPEIMGFIGATLFALICGTIMAQLFREGRDLQGIKEGYAIVTFGWIALAFISSIPFCLYFMAARPEGLNGIVLAFSDGFFEVMSGFTTTGASILTDIEAVPRSLLFLRALTHWLGGMGIITLALVIFPAMGVVGYQMFRGEVPGPTTEKLYPRLAQTASILWGVYLLLTAVESGLLMVGGMNLFDAICHSFATMATGGFSTKNASIAAYDSDFIQWVIIIFMYFAGINFVLHFRALRGDLTTMFSNREFRFYTGVIVAAIVIITAVLYINGLASMETASQHYRHAPMESTQFAEHYVAQMDHVENLYTSFRTAAFQSLSIITTTGFATADFDLWPDFLRFLMIFLMFFGGCAGSTGGGMKIIRVMIAGKVGLRELRKLTQPRLVAPIKVGTQVIDDSRAVNVVSFVLIFVALFVLTAMLMTLFVPDLITAVACSIATIGNIGPGLAGVGAVENYSWIPIPGKWILIMSMLLGRLEIFTVLIVLRPAVWRK
jgi:trk system potassium uptake protein TrkH